jgi:hypothetical protein
MSAFISMQEGLYLKIYWTSINAPDTLLQATQTQPPQPDASKPLKIGEFYFLPT